MKLADYNYLTDSFLQLFHRTTAWFKHKITPSRNVICKPDLPLLLLIIFALAGCGGGGGGGASAPAVLPVLTVTNASVVEGNAGISNLVFTVTSSAASTSAITVNYATADGTALAGSDYTATNGTLTIPAGATGGTVIVSVLGDTVIEADETFTLALSTPRNASIAMSLATGTIINDDFNTVGIAPASVAEGNAGTSILVFTITASVAMSSAITLHYATTDGTARAATDYTAKSGILTIPAGSTSATITVLINGDTVFEQNETLMVTLSAPSINATLGAAIASGTIINDDTGITTWGNATANNLTVSQLTFPRQDADIGRDTKPTLNSNADGKSGFSYTKFDNSGSPLANQAATYATLPWSCIQDNVTGLMWEVKTKSGAGGLRDASYTYTWYNSTGVNDGLTPGVANGGTCADTINCDTEKYVSAVNATGLCGYTDWRLPQREDLLSIIDYSIAAFRLAIDVAYFPNTQSNTYWSAPPFGSLGAWDVLFGFGGSVSIGSRGTSSYVRLVRGG